MDLIKKLSKTQDKPKIRVYRQYMTFQMINAKTVEITKHFYLFVSSKTALWVYPMDEYVANLRITNSDGNSLPILSEKELSYMLRSQAKKDLDITETTITQERLKEIFNKQNVISSKQPTQSSIKEAKHYVGIILPQYEDDHFDEVIIKWVAPVDKLKIEEKVNRGLNLDVGIQHIIPPTSAASTYLDIQTDDDQKYEIIGDTTILADDINCVKKESKEGDEYRELLKTKAHRVYRIKRDAPTTFTIQWKVGIPNVIRRWAWLGFFLSIAVMVYSVITFWQDHETFVRNSALLSGIISLVVGFRVLLFHDTELMSRWNSLYILLLVVAVALILIMGYIK